MNFKGTYTFLGLVVSAMLATSSVALAKNSNPSSGRSLQSGHWLTCWGGQSGQLRSDPPMNKKTSQADVDNYVNQISQAGHWTGAYGFEVKDTWEEWVTHSGSDCGHCGETCHEVTTGSGDNETTTEDCSCNFCSWQELETFYRPWSNQTVQWMAHYQQNSADQAYKKKREEWIAAGSQKVSHEKGDLAKLLEFDPERPYKGFLFPGEMEYLVAGNGSTLFGAMLVGASESISPNVRIEKGRHEYTYSDQITDELGRNRGSALECDDVDLKLNSSFTAGKRKVSTTPNSLIFKPESWLEAVDKTGADLKANAFRVKVTDMAATAYAGQAVFEHYEDTHIELQVAEIDRAWWFDRFTSKATDLSQMENKLSYGDVDPKTGLKMGTYTLTSGELLKTHHFDTPFGLHPGKSYMVCGRVIRRNNVYYQEKGGWIIHWDKWSDDNCAQFNYLGPDERTGGRKFRDGLTRVIGLPLW
jgi:hypothetical protein